jgi:uncharacterized protein YjbI with pentapeptide repeats
MKILLEPNFMFENGNYEGYVGINSMLDGYQDILDGEIVAELEEIFPEPERDIKRVGETNYYSVDMLNDDIDSINTWYKTHLYKATNERGYVERDSWTIQLQEDVDYAPEDGQEFDVDEMTIRTNAGEILFPDLDFDTAEGRADAMGYVNIDNDLYGVDIENLYAKETNFMGLTFDDSKLNKSVFTEAFLPMTKFNRCKLREADFRYADLMYASFQQADLTGANFKDANLRGAIFHGSNWKDAINLANNPTFTEPTTRIASAQKLILQQQEAEDDEALPGDKNTCYAVIDLYDKNIDKYLEKDPGNFILINGKNKECESLTNLKQQYFSEELNDYEGYYECSQSVIDWQNAAGHTKIAFNPEDYITDVEYVKVGSANHYIVKPKWFYAGPVPEPRMFNLVSTGKKKRLISKRIAKLYGSDVVSDVHCDPLDTFEIYRLKPVFLKAITLRKTTKRTARKTTARKTTARKLRKVLHRQTKRRSLTAADETTAGGGRKHRSKKRKHKKIKHT